MQTVFSRANGLFIVGILMLPGFAQATPVCATGSLASVISLGSCTIGDATFGFSPTSFPIWFPGLTTSDSVQGPAASNVFFTPIVSATSAGFNLAGAFTVSGNPSTYFPLSNRIESGNRMDIQFGYVQVTSLSSASIVGVQLAMGGTSVSTDNTNNLASLNDSGGAAVYETGDGLVHLSDSVAVGPTNSFLDLLFVRAWDYSGDLASRAGFTDFTYTVNLQSASVDPGPSVPEPATLGLMGLALAGLAFRRRNRKSGQD